MNAPNITTTARIGDLLVDRGVLSQDDLDRAVAVQEREGGRLGRILVNEGIVRRLDLYRCLAEDMWRLRFVDLHREPCDPSLGDGIDKVAMINAGFVPWLRNPDGTLTVAVCEDPDADRCATIASIVGVDIDHLDFVGTTDWDVEWAWLASWGEEICELASNELADESPDLSAKGGFARWQKVAAGVSAAFMAVSLIRWPLIAFITFFAAANAGYTAAIWFKVACAVVGRRATWRQREQRWEAEIRGDDSADHLARRDPADLPTFTVLIPAYKESEVIATIISNLGGLRWPASKLEVLLLMEADDAETIEAARAASPPEFVRFVLLPDVGPRTKPKACNVGLMLAKGEYVVIYDAEDRPDPDQLLLIDNTFRQLGDDFVCLQARLNYFNAYDNVLTRLFTLEYSAWFDYMLPGLDAMRLPIPLGGTSNHFRTEVLRELRGWDAWNVTEDADLGLRAGRLGYRVGIVNSTTWEEACAAWKPWIKQRTRWIKGYLVTAQVHLRHPWRVARESGWRGLFGLLVLITGTPITFLVWPLLLAATIVSLFIPDQMTAVMPMWMQRASAVNLIVGNLAMMALVASAVGRRKLWPLLTFSLIVPAYYALHAIAAWRAAYQMVFDPFKWEKTPHGISPSHDGNILAEHP